jgi:hypothetical protein
LTLLIPTPTKLPLYPKLTLFHPKTSLSSYHLQNQLTTSSAPTLCFSELPLSNNSPSYYLIPTPSPLLYSVRELLSDPNYLPKVNSFNPYTLRWSNSQNPIQIPPIAQKGNTLVPPPQ